MDTLQSPKTPSVFGLSEGSSPHQKLIDGKIFPKIFLPTRNDAQDDEMLQLLKRNRAFLEEQLREFGALLLRGFPLHSAAHFNALVEAIGWEEMAYVGPAPRTQVVGRVYSASDASPEVNIPFHHEMLQIKSGFPSKILFFCDVEPADGGQTPIVLSHKITEKMREEFPDFVRNLEEQGLLYIKVLPSATDPSDFTGQAWPIVFGSADRTQAEKRAESDFGARLEWLPGGDVKMIAGPHEGVRAFDEERGRKVWFNAIMIYGTQGTKDAGGESGGMNGGGPRRPHSRVVFEDGLSLPADVVARCKQVHEETCVDIPWRKGDVMILDNLAVMHGRRPCYHPRRILVALCR